MQIPASLTASRWLWLRIHHTPPCVSRGMARKPCAATNSIVPQCARPPIPAWLAALIGCTAGCQTTDWLLPTIFGHVLIFLMTTSGIKTKNKKQILTEYYLKQIHLICFCKHYNVKFCKVFDRFVFLVRKLTWRGSITVCGILRRPIYSKYLFARDFFTEKENTGGAWSCLWATQTLTAHLKLNILSTATRWLWLQNVMDNQTSPLSAESRCRASDIKKISLENVRAWRYRFIK